VHASSLEAARRAHVGDFPRRARSQRSSNASASARALQSPHAAPFVGYRRSHAMVEQDTTAEERKGHSLLVVSDFI
jgi:hypothetical protein